MKGAGGRPGRPGNVARRCVCNGLASGLRGAAIDRPGRLSLNEEMLTS